MNYIGHSSALPCENSHILLACMPKAASRRVLAMVQEHPEMEHILLNETDSNLVESLDTFNFLIQHNQSWISHHHVHCALTLPQKLKRFSVKTVVLTRNLYDICVSVRDHMQTASDSNSLVMLAHITTNTREFGFWSEQQQFDFIINMVVPWYIKFYVSWQTFPRLHDYHPIWIDYDQVINNPEEILTGIFKFGGLEFTAQQVNEIVQKVDLDRPNFNVGKAGRGADLLSDEQKARIKELCSYYPEIDFSPIGIN